MNFVIRHDAAHEAQALQLARYLFAQFDEAIDSLALIPTDDEACAVFLDGRLVHSQSASGTPPRVSDVTMRLSQRNW